VVNSDQYSTAKTIKDKAALACYVRHHELAKAFDKCTDYGPEDSMASGRTMSCKSRDLLIGIGSQRSTREYCDKEKIYSQGDIATAMYYVESGHVKLTVASPRGKNAVLAILGKGDLLGQDCLVNGAKRTTTATALQPSIITCVEKSVLNEIIQREPKFSNLFVLDLLSRMRRVEEDFTDQLLHSSEMRLARLLLRLSHFGEPGTADTDVLHISQGTLAEMVGTTRSRVSFFMNRFRELGLIEYNGSLHVHRSLRTFLQGN